MRAGRKPEISDLHSYRIRDGVLGEWIEVWRREVLPLRIEHGFDVRSVCTDKERSRFTWVLSIQAHEERERTRRYWAAQVASGVNPMDYIYRAPDSLAVPRNPEIVLRMS